MDVGVVLLGGGVVLVALALSLRQGGRTVTAKTVVGQVNQGNIKAGGDVTLTSTVTQPAPRPNPPRRDWTVWLGVVGSIASIVGLIMTLLPGKTP